MTTNRTHRNRPHSNKTPNRSNRDKILVQKDRQEVQQSKDDPFLKRKQELLDETQEFMYNQSSKFSTVSRNLILGIVGTIWILTYSDGKLDIPNGWLLWSLLLAIFFLLVDLIHYFWDTMSYHDELYKLDEYKSQDEIDHIHEPKMDSINKRSHKFIVFKFCMLLITSILFLVGIIVKSSLI